MHLSFDAANLTPMKQFWKGLGVFLQALPNLIDLHVGFAPFTTGIIDHGVWWNSEKPKEWYVPLWKIIDPDFVWPSLSKLRMDGMIFCEKGLWNLLCRHTKTLNSLVLSNIGLWEGGFRHLLEHLRDNLSLQSFAMGGRIRGFHTDHEAWFLPRIIEDTSNEIWHKGLADFVSQTGFGKECWCEDETVEPAGNCWCVGFTAHLEAFVLRNRDWPVDQGPENAIILDEFADRVHSIGCDSNCHLTGRNLDDLWADRRWNDDEEEWDTTSSVAFETDNGGNEIVERYNTLGYDL